MTRQLRSVAFTAFIAALSMEISAAEAKQQCSAEMPSDPHGHWWSYRLIDGRKCWYEGKPGLSKALLEWPNTSAQPASGEDAASSFPRKPPNPPASQAWTPTPTMTEEDSFEARWENIGSRAQPEDIAAESEVNDGPPLAKADRLRSPYLDGGRQK